MLDSLHSFRKLSATAACKWVVSNNRTRRCQNQQALPLRSWHHCKHFPSPLPLTLSLRNSCHPASALDSRQPFKVLYLILGQRVLLHVVVIGCLFIQENKKNVKFTIIHGEDFYRKVKRSLLLNMRCRGETSNPTPAILALVMRLQPGVR